MNGSLPAAASNAKHGDQVAGAAADFVHNSLRMTVMSQSSTAGRTSHLLFSLCILCLFLSTGCALSKNLLGKSTLQSTALPVQTATNPGTASPDCAVPNSQPKPTELTAYPVAPQTTAQTVATGNSAPVNNGVPQQSVIQQPATQQQYTQQPPAQQQPAQQPQYTQQQPVIQQPYVQQPQPAASQQSSAVAQQPSQQPLAQTTTIDTATQTQQQTVQLQQNQQPSPSLQTAPSMAAGIATVPDQSQLLDPNAPGLPAATISPNPAHPKELGGPEMTAAPTSAYRAQTHSGAAAASNCPPGTVPGYGYLADSVSSPEKLAECEKQVFEMNQKLNELQFNTIKATLTMEQMAEQQRQLIIDNERLRRRAELADKRYLEELDSLSEIVGEVVSQAGSGNKSSSADKPSPGTNSLRPVPQSATGQSL